MEASSLCCCCLLKTSDKDLKTLYSRLGITEVFSEMLEECFQIHLIQDSDEERGICEECVARLRDANDFKRQVQRSQAQLHQRLEIPIRVSDLDQLLSKMAEYDRTRGESLSLGGVAVKTEMDIETTDDVLYEPSGSEVKSEVVEGDETTDMLYEPGGPGVKSGAAEAEADGRTDILLLFSGAGPPLLRTYSRRPQPAPTCPVRLEPLRDKAPHACQIRPDTCDLDSSLATHEDRLGMPAEVTSHLTRHKLNIIKNDEYNMETRKKNLNITFTKTIKNISVTYVTSRSKYLSSAEGIEEWILFNKRVSENEESTSQYDAAAPGGGGGEPGGEFSAMELLELNWGDNAATSDDDAATTDDEGRPGRPANSGKLSIDERAWRDSNLARAFSNNFRKSPWKLFCKHTRGCGARNDHWHIISISTSNQWGHNSELGRIIRKSQHKCESVTCLACLVQYLCSGNGRTIIKNILSRSDFEASKCSFHCMAGTAARQERQDGDAADAEGRARTSSEQSLSSALGERGMGNAAGEADVFADGRRGMEHEQARAAFREEPAPGTRRHGLIARGDPGNDNFTNAKLVLYFVEERAFTQADGERVLTQTPEGIEFMFKRNNKERITTACTIARILVFQETLKKRMERCRKYQLKMDTDCGNEVTVMQTLKLLQNLLQANNIDQKKFATVTFKHLQRQMGKLNNLFFYGIPNTGKTMIMESLAELHYNYCRITGLVPTSPFNFASVVNTNACFMDECKLTDNQFEQWKLLAAGSKMDTDVKYKERGVAQNCRLYSAANFPLGMYVQTVGAEKAIEQRTTQFNFNKQTEIHFNCTIFVWEKFWSNYNLVV